MPLLSDSIEDELLPSLRQPACVCELKRLKQLYYHCPARVAALRVRVCVCLSTHPPARARETSAIVEVFSSFFFFYTLTAGTKNNPVLSKFVIFKATLFCF